MDGHAEGDDHADEWTMTRTKTMKMGCCMNISRFIQYRGRKKWPKSRFYMKFDFLIKFDGFKAWDFDFWTTRVDAILADVLILKNDALWAISKESLWTCVKNVVNMQ